MYSPSSVNVAAFDPYHGADQARAYATKYASKPEKWYYMETQGNALKDWLKCRTVGLLNTPLLSAYLIPKHVRVCEIA